MKVKATRRSLSAIGWASAINHRSAADARGSESPTRWHRGPDGVYLNTSVAPSGAPAVRQNAVMSPHALPLSAAAITSTTAVRLIGLTGHYGAEHRCDRPAPDVAPQPSSLASLRKWAGPVSPFLTCGRAIPFSRPG